MKIQFKQNDTNIYDEKVLALYQQVCGMVEGVIKVFISVLYRVLYESAPTKLRRKLSDFPTKTVPDGVHDGEDEVEAVADVEGDQDVVEAVAHLFPSVQDACYEDTRSLENFPEA